MAKKRPDETYILDMKKAVESALEFTKGMHRDQFDKDPKCQSAVLYQLAVLGEAAKQVSKEFRSAHSEFKVSSRLATSSRLKKCFEL